MALSSAGIVLLALARIGAGLELLMGDDARAEFLGRILERLGHRRVGRQRALQHQKIAPLARHQILHEAVHAHGEARQRVHELGGAEIAAQRVVRRRGVEQQHVAAVHGVGERLERLGRRIDDEEMDVAASRACMHGRRDLGRRFHRDALEREVDLEHAGERLRLVDADLRAGERMLAGLEHRGARRRVIGS